MFDKRLATKATYINEQTLSCTTPASDNLSPIDVDVEILHLSRPMNDALEVTPTILDQSSRTEGVVTYKYALPLRLISVEPSVVFTTDNSGVYIRGEDLYATNDLKCVWSSNGDITSTTA